MEDGGVVVERGEDHYRGRGGILGDTPRSPHSVQHRHSQIHEHDVRSVLGRHPDRLLAISRLAHHLEPVRLQHLAQTFAEERLIVGDQHPGHPGSSISSVKPRPCALRTDILPPTLSALSRRPRSPKPWPIWSAPTPSSSTRRRIPSLAAKASSMVSREARAWRRTLVSASCAAR